MTPRADGSVARTASAGRRWRSVRSRGCPSPRPPRVGPDVVRVRSGRRRRLSSGGTVLIARAGPSPARTSSARYAALLAARCQPVGGATRTEQRQEQMRRTPRRRRRRTIARREGSSRAAGAAVSLMGLHGVRGRRPDCQLGGPALRRSRRRPSAARRSGFRLIVHSARFRAGGRLPAFPSRRQGWDSLPIQIGSVRGCFSPRDSTGLAIPRDAQTSA
jgi:hypothetical protein